MLAQAQECVFEQIGLPGIRNEFFTLVKMTQEVAKVKYESWNLVFQITVYSAMLLATASSNTNNLLNLNANNHYWKPKVVRDSSQATMRITTFQKIKMQIAAI